MINEIKDVVELRARCARGLHRKIKEAANESARSVSAEISHRLKKSFELEAEAHRETKSVI
jgi:Arc-like DNA binding domain